MGLIFVYLTFRGEPNALVSRPRGQPLSLYTFIDSCEGFWFVTTAILSAVIGTWFRSLSRIIQLLTLSVALGMTFSAAIDARGATHPLKPWGICSAAMIGFGLIGSLFATWWFPHREFVLRAILSLCAAYFATAAVFMSLAGSVPRFDDAVQFLMLTWPLCLANITPPEDKEPPSFE